MPTANAFNDWRQVAKRQQVMMEGLGYYAETCPRSILANATVGVTQRVYYVAVGLLAGDIVSRLSIHITTAAATVSLCKVGLYSKAQALLASSTDQSASWVSAGIKDVTLSLQSNGTPLIIPTDDVYYAAILSVGTTPPTCSRG